MFIVGQVLCAGTIIGILILDFPLIIRFTQVFFVVFVFYLKHGLFLSIEDVCEPLKNSKLE
jgi:hypothetical protein